MPNTKRNVLILLVGLALVAMATLLYATQLGIGLNSDSVTFVKAARSLASGQGLSKPQVDGTFTPLTHFPPLYPTLLGVLAASGLDLLNGARWLSIVLFGANIVIVGLAIYECTAHSIALTILGALLMATSADMLKVHSYAWSEPPFITLGAVALFLLAGHLDRPRWWLLVLSGLATALAVLTRYTGPALLVAGVLSLLLVGAGTRRRKLIDAVAFATLAIAPMGLWALRNLWLSGGVTDRRLILHPPSSEHLEHAVRTIAGWLLPRYAIAGPLALLAPIAILEMLAMAALAGIVLARPAPGGPGPGGASAPKRASALSLLGIFVVVYVLFLLVSISLFDANTPLNDRILAPAFVAGLVLVLSLGHELLGPMKGPAWVQTASLVVAVAVAGNYHVQAMRYVDEMHDGGQGYASRAWQRSKIVAWVRQLPPETPIVANRPDAIYIMTGRMAQGTPKKINMVTQETKADYAAEFLQTRELLEKGAVLVYFDGKLDADMPSAAELEEALPVRAVFTAPDGVIYEFAP